MPHTSPNSDLEKCLNNILFGSYTPDNETQNAWFCPAEGPLAGRYYRTSPLSTVRDKVNAVGYVRRNVSIDAPRLYDLLLLGEGWYQQVQPVAFIRWSSFVEAKKLSVFEFLQNDATGLLHFNTGKGLVHRAIPVVYSSPYVVLGFSATDTGLTFSASQLLVGREKSFSKYLFGEGFQKVNSTDTADTFCFTPPPDVLKDKSKNEQWDSGKTVFAYTDWYSFPIVGDFFVDQKMFLDELKIPNGDPNAYLLLRKWYDFWPRKNMWIHENTLMGKTDFYQRLTIDHLKSLQSNNVIVCNKERQYALSDVVWSYGKKHHWGELSSAQVSLFWVEQEQPIADSCKAAAEAVKAKTKTEKEQLAVEQASESAKKAKAEAAEEQFAAEQAKAEAKKAKAAAEEAQLAAEQAKADALNAKAEAKEEQLAAEQAKADALNAKAKAREEQLAAEQAKADAKKSRAAAEEELRATEKVKADAVKITADAVKITADADRVKASVLEAVHVDEDPEAEMKAITDFWKALNGAGWRYSLRDIVRFHTSVRCEPLTILGGAPGSGKSSLARMYASFFGLGEDNSFLSIDVQPSWHDRMDFLGFVKTHEDTPEFVPSETGIAKFLKDAETDNGKSGIWLACLEEINLARPEHYFADFLQRISLDDDKRKKSPVELRGLPAGNEAEGRFTLVPSVRFIGTCNFDETTQNFSARFLDRCNYIEFQPLRIIDAFFPADGKYPNLLVFDFDEKSKWTWHPIENLPRKRMDADPNEKEVKELITNCEESLKTLGVLPSPRVISSMIRYIEARIDSVNEELTDEKVPDTSIKKPTVFQRAFDEAFAQRILSKLSISRGCYPGTGTKKTLENLKKNLNLGKVPLSLCSEMIERYISQFDTIMNS